MEALPDDVVEVPTAPEGLTPGFVLLSDLMTTKPTLRNAWGEVVHTWPREGALAFTVQLLDDGSILRAVNSAGGPAASHGRWDRFGGGVGGRIERVAWDGSLLWQYDIDSDEHIQHHAITAMPNGHVLAVVWEWVPHEQAVSAGRLPGTVDDDGLWMDAMYEIAPTGADAGEIVWSWHAIDHVGEGPRKLDIQRTMTAFAADWSHVNAVTYDAYRDEVLVSARSFSEVWIVDHSTTEEEAASDRGGRHGFGGDLVYRWGNPEAYGAGTKSNQHLYVQHDVRVIPEGWTGAGDLTVFNNGPIPPRGTSAVTQWTPPRDRDGFYVLTDDQFGPASPSWEASPAMTPTFLSGFMSGAQRLEDGTTLVVEALQARVTFLDAEGDVLYSYSEADRLQRDDLGGFFRGEWIPLDHPGVQRLLP